MCPRLSGVGEGGGGLRMRTRGRGIMKLNSYTPIKEAINTQDNTVSAQIFMSLSLMESAEIRPPR